MSTTVQRSDAAANRDRVVTAARGVFVERGLDAEMKEIADRAGLGVGTIYRNFATKDELVEAVIASCMADSMVEIRAAMAVEEPGPRIIALAGVGWSSAERFGPLIRALGMPRQVSEQHPARELLELVAQAFREGLAAGVVHPGLDPEFAANYLASQFHAYVDLRQLHPESRVRAQMTELFQRAVLVCY